MSKPATLLKAEPASGHLPSDSFCTMYRFWLNARGGAELPPQSAIDAGKFPSFAVPNLSLTLVGPGPKRYFIKFAGDEIIRGAGVDVRGKYPDDIPGAGATLEHIDTCIRARQPYFFSGPVTSGTTDFLTHAALILPYAEPGGRISQLLTYVEYG